MTTLVYIHGANASGESFNYIRDHLNYDNEIVIEYSSKNGFENNLNAMVSALANIKDIFFICHSLGGMYALHLANLIPTCVKGAVTISTPYGGAEVADYAKYFLPFSRLLKDIGPNSKPIKSANKIKTIHPWTNLVTIKGDSPWMLHPNDGVVTINSMRHRKDMELIEVMANHYEVVIMPQTVNHIKRAIETVIGKIFD